MSENPPPVVVKPKIGFAAMPQEQHKKIAAKGGEAAHKLGTAHRFTSEEARAAGLKGWENRRAKKEGTYKP